MKHDAAAESSLAEGQMRAIEIAGHKLLLAKVAGACHAITGTCPHAGAPLSEGVLQGEAVICPWHKAAFSIRTGQRLQPPAVDNLQAYACHVEDGRILIEIPGAPAKPAPSATKDERCMVIVGAGAAGATAAQTLRESGFTGRVILIGQEPRLPYDRTILSKYTLSAKQGGEKTPLQTEAFYNRLNIERLTATVQTISPTAQTITFTDGNTLAYNSCLAATGAIPRKLQIRGAHLPGVFTLRTAADAEAIASAAASAKSAVIAGAGFIAMEAAASLRERGLAVTVVAPQQIPFERVLGPEIGRAFQRVHEREGINFQLDTEIIAIEGTLRAERVRLKNGATLQADLVIAGLGVTPATSLIQGVPKQKDASLKVDATLRVAENLYAAGDIAAFPLYGATETIRVEHWRVAQQHGRIAALNMLGANTPYDAVPYFWTIHFLKRLDYIGHAEHWDEIVIDGDLEEPKFLAFYLQNKAVAAIAGWGQDRQMAAAIGLMTQRKQWPVEDLRRALK